MILNILVVNTKIIPCDVLNNIIDIAKDEYGCVRLPSYNHFMLCAVHDDDVDNLLSDVEDLNIGNPAYEVVRKEVCNQAELDALSFALELDPK